jgi:Tol biopolymer transport system component
LVLRDVVSPNCNLWAIDLQRGARTRVTLEGDNHNPVWRSDGQLTWSSALEDSRSMRMAQIDRPSRITTLPPSPNERMPESWSRDGEHLAFTEIHPQTGRDIFILSVKSGAIRPFANSNFTEQDARFSPDGRWLAYSADESGRGEVYMAPVDADGGRMQISVNGGHSPLWSPDGRELFYVEGAALMTVAIDLRPAKPDVSRPRKLLEGRYVWERNGNFDITPDGKHFIFVRRTEDSDPPATLRVLLNWLRPQ